VLTMKKGGKGASLQGSNHDHLMSKRERPRCRPTRGTLRNDKTDVGIHTKEKKKKTPERRRSVCHSRRKKEISTPWKARSLTSHHQRQTPPPKKKQPQPPPRCLAPTQRGTCVPEGRKTPPHHAKRHGNSSSRTGSRREGSGRSQARQKNTSSLKSFRGKKGSGPIILFKAQVSNISSAVVGEGRRGSVAFRTSGGEGFRPLLYFPTSREKEGKAQRG